MGRKLSGTTWRALTTILVSTKLDRELMTVQLETGHSRSVAAYYLAPQLQHSGCVSRPSEWMCARIATIRIMYRTTERHGVLQAVYRGKGVWGVGYEPQPARGPLALGPEPRQCDRDRSMQAVSSSDLHSV